MDKKSIIGLVIIGIVLIGFSWYNNKQLQEYNEQKAVVDSINAVQAIDRINSMLNDTVSQRTDAGQATETLVSAREQHLGSSLYQASFAPEEFYTVENDVMKLIFSSKGGRVASVILKDYKSYTGKPLRLFAQESSLFDLSFFIQQNNYNNLQINTSEYNFSWTGSDRNLFFTENEDEKTVALRLPVDSTAYVEYLYRIKKDNYMIDFDVRFVGMDQLLLPNQSNTEVVWRTTTYQNEKGFENENNYTDICYYFPRESSIEKVGISKESKSERINSRLTWVGFKQQFFSSILVARDDFQNADVEYTTYAPTSDSLKTFNARLSVPFSTTDTDYNFQFYYGPNKYSVLKKYDLHFEHLIPLGWWLIGLINRWIVIPVFDLLGNSISSYGLIILILTILIKILIAPLTYKSYLSTARMRLLKPEIDEINAKYPKPDDAMKKQQATMELYKRAKVSPIGGCLPMLIQFPILIAMFRFFPASIELRGESFLWADDLSSYDSILELPFNIPFYGSHISLFTLLMAISVYISSRINYNQTAQSAPQMVGMKFMMLYMMPVMLMIWFNNYASGLSYYYLVSNIITIGQTFAFRYAVNDEKLHKQMKENAKKPVKKSKWQQRYDELMKQQQQQQRQVAKKKK